MSSQQVSLGGPIIFMLFGVPLLALIFTFPYRNYLRTSFGNAYWLAVAAVIAGLVTTWAILRNTPNVNLRPIIPGPQQVSISSFLLPIFIVPLLSKIYGAWLGGRLTEAERRSGAEGFRAWLSPGNLVCVAAIALCVWLALDYSFWAVLIIGLAALSAYPLMVSASAADSPAAAGAGAAARDSRPSEKEQVLRLLEEGKIEADDAADLLNALSGDASAATSANPPAPWTRRQKLILAGAVLALTGFVLPWFSVNLGDELQRAAEKLPLAAPLSKMMGGESGETIYITGSDAPYGLGWILLGVAIAVALVNLMPNQMAPGTRRQFTSVLVVIGSALLSYLVLDNLRHVSVGLVVVVIGYGLMIAASWAQTAKATAPMPVAG